eukprot:6490966-Amphidinium_carterae.1
MGAPGSSCTRELNKGCKPNEPKRDRGQDSKQPISAGLCATVRMALSSLHCFFSPLEVWMNISSQERKKN